MPLHCIYYRFGDTAFRSKIATPLYSAPPLDLRNNPWWRKTRMMGLSDSERISIRSAVLTQHACDRQTGGIAVAYTRYSMLSRVKRKWGRGNDSWDYVTSNLLYSPHASSFEERLAKRWTSVLHWGRAVRVWQNTYPERSRSCVHTSCRKRQFRHSF